MALFLCLYLFSLYHRYIQQDEPWFGEQVYWLAKEGKVKIKSMPGVFDWTANMLIYHKLFIWIGALLVLGFGWSVYIFKAFILAVFVFTCWLVISFLKSYAGPDSKLPLVAIFLLTTIPELIHRSFMFRPEVLVMCFGFLSFYMLYKTLSENKSAVHWAAFFAGLAVLTHLNGLIFPVAGFVLLLLFKKWKALIPYSLVCGLVCMVYTIGLWQDGHWQTYIYQMQHWPTHQKTFGEKVRGGLPGIFWNNILRLLNEHQRYFWDQDVWMISALFLLSLISHFKYLWRQHRVLTGYTLILMVSLGALSSGNSPRYLVYQMPFMAIISSLVLYKLIQERMLILKGLVLLIFAGQLVIVGLTFSKIYRANYDHAQVHREVLSGIVPGSKVLAPWEFIYNEIDQYHLYSFKTYEYIEDQEKRELSQNEFLSLAANRFGMEYIVIDKKRKMSRDFPWFYDWQIADNRYYTIYNKDEDFLILKKN